MTRLLKYLKPYSLLIVIVIGLLFVQANADLALPDYMSRIVNVGIQQGGVENAVPVALRQSTMNKLTLFMSPSDETKALNDYQLIDQNSADYNKYLQDYPALAKEPVYVLRSLDQSEIDKLNPIMGRAFLAVSGIQEATADPTKLKQLAGSGSTTGPCAGLSAMSSGMSQLPPGMDVFALLGQIPDAQRVQLANCVNSKFAALGDSMIIQAAAAPIKAEYTALGMDTGALQTSYILHSGGLMLLLSLLSVTCTIIVSYLAARSAAGLARDLRKFVFEKVESFSNTEFDKFSTASLITRSTNDITQIQMVVIMMVRMVFYAPIIGVGGIIRALGKGSGMWWIIAVVVVAMISLVLVVFTVALPKFKIIQTLIDRLNLVTRENLSGMMVIRAFNMQSFEEKRFDKANKDLTSTMLFVSRVMVVMFPVMMFIMNGLTVLIIWVGAHQVANSSMQVGDMIAFMQYTMQIAFAFLMLSMMFIILPRASVSAGRIADVLETDPVIRDPEQPKSFDALFEGTVEFKDVSFRYPGGEEDALHDINFTALPGQTTAIIGPTGSGKTTVVNLIPRFYEVTSGSIRIDGVDIREVTQHDLRAKIGYVPQKNTLFSGTIESNLCYGDENTSDEILQDAVDVAQATEFINERQEGLAAEISQSGKNVSGGQKQRLSIARALVKRAPVYIFDDSFSALDFKTDSALRRALKDKMRSSTVLIVTQRIATIKNAEQIIVLDEGRVVGKGTHSELMKNCDTYREIAMSQLSMEELA